MTNNFKFKKLIIYLNTYSVYFTNMENGIEFIIPKEAKEDTFLKILEGQVKTEFLEGLRIKALKIIEKLEEAIVDE